MKVLIIGNGIAGISVAKELRALRPDPRDLSITVLARESYDYYSRIRLPEVFGGGSLGAEFLALYKPGWYAERSIEVRLGQDVAALDRPGGRVILSSGAELPYDRLVLALGADPLRPELPGAFLPGVFTVREYDDAARVRASVGARPESAAVAGGGLLGLEAARRLLDFGVRRLSVLELAPRLLPRQLDSGGAAVLEAVFAGLGVEILTSARIAAFEGMSRVESIRLEDGRRVPAATVVVSMGVRPRTGLARAAGLATARGVVVDDFLRTSDPAVSAVGDCAEHRGVSWGIIPAALEQARPCAAAILGDESAPYSGTIPANSLKVAGVELSSAGEVEVEEEEGTRILVRSPGPGRYERIVVRDGLVTGAIVIGSRERARAAVALVGAQGSAEAAERFLRD